MNRRRTQGFTLIELTVTIVVSAIVVSFMAVFIASPVRSYTDQVRRGKLVDLADNALQRIARDIRSALPNSIRVATNGSIVSLEMLNSIDGVRYRERPPPDDATKQLDFAAPDDAFNTIGPFTGIAKPFSSNTHYLSIYNVGVPTADAYELANVITPPGTQIDIVADALPGEDNVTLAPAFRFAYGSPAQRLYLVDGPINYLCDSSSGTLTRYDGYAIAPNHADRDTGAELAAAGGSDSTVSNQIGSCSISYAPGTSQRAGLVTLALTLADSGETVTLLRQVHVTNVP